MTDIFPSDYEEWEPLESFIGKFDAVHENIGKLLHDGESSSSLRQRNMYWYNARYITPKRKALFGHLECIAAPQLDEIDCGMEDAKTLTSFKEKIRKDMAMAMKFTFGSKWSRLSWFMPLHIFAQCFKTVRMHRSATMWTCKNVDANVLEDLLGKSWDLRTGQQNGDLFRCYACKESVVARYHIARQVFYLAFQYRRWKKTGDSWLPLDSNEEDTNVTLSIELDHEDLKYVNVTSQWTLKDVREHLLVMEGLMESFVFLLDGRRVPKRHEKSLRSEKFIPPAKLQIKGHSVGR